MESTIRGSQDLPPFFARREVEDVILMVIQVFWLLPPFFLFTIAFGGATVPKINLIMDLICRDYLADVACEDPTVNLVPVVLGTDNEQCRHLDEVQRRVARFTLLQSVIAGLLSAITSPKLGELSDRYGRKKIIAFTGIGTMLAEILTILAAKYPDSVHVNWILVGYALDGLCGSFVAAMALTFAYASDCTPPAKRAIVFGYFHGCLFGGIALGPLFAGYIYKATKDVLTIFYIAAAFHAAFFLFIGLVVPESLTKERQRQARTKKSIKDDEIMGLGQGLTVNWFSRFWAVARGSNIFAPLTVLWPTGKGTNPDVRRNLALLAAVDTTMFGVAMGSMSVILIYSEYMFDWGTFEASIFQSIVNICRVTNLLLVLPLIIRVFRGPSATAVQKQTGSDRLDLSIIRAAIAFDMLGYVGYATARIGPLFILSGALASVGGMGSPTISSAMTKHVPQDRTGQLLGAVGLLHALARVVAPTIFNTIYYYTVGKFTQTVFVCLASTFGIAFTISWFIKPHGRTCPPCSIKASTETNRYQCIGTNQKSRIRNQKVTDARCRQ